MEYVMPTMIKGKLDSELNNKICNLLLMEQRTRTKELLNKFYHVDTYWINGKTVRVQGHILFGALPHNLPNWFSNDITDTKAVISDDKLLIEVWNTIITEELPF